MPVINKRKYGRLIIGGISFGVIVGTNIYYNSGSGYQLCLVIQDGHDKAEFDVTHFSDIQYFSLQNFHNDFIIDWGENADPERRKLLCQ